MNEELIKETKRLKLERENVLNERKTAETEFETWKEGKETKKTELVRELESLNAQIGKARGTLTTAKLEGRTAEGEFGDARILADGESQQASILTESNANARGEKSELVTDIKTLKTEKTEEEEAQNVALSERNQKMKDKYGEWQEKLLEAMKDAKDAKKDKENILKEVSEHKKTMKTEKAVVKKGQAKVDQYMEAFRKARAILRNMATQIKAEKSRDMRSALEELLELK